MHQVQVSQNDEARKVAKDVAKLVLCGEPVCLSNKDSRTQKLVAVVELAKREVGKGYQYNELVVAESVYNKAEPGEHPKLHHRVPLLKCILSLKELELGGYTFERFSC